MKRMKIVSVMIMMMSLVLLFTASVPALAASGTDQNVGTEAVVSAGEEETGESDVLSSKAMAAALVVGLVGAAGAIGMAIAIGKSTEGMARQPEAAGKINSAMMLGLVFIETAIIYALIIAILIIFVL